jgi:hypothetical protein
MKINKTIILAYINCKCEKKLIYEKKVVAQTMEMFIIHIQIYKCSLCKLGAKKIILCFINNLIIHMSFPKL